MGVGGIGGGGHGHVHHPGGTTGPAAVDPTAHGGHHGVHGMVVFGGKDRLYMSHIPMFQPPHDRQILLEVKMPPIRGVTSFADRLFTFKPDEFSLEDLRAGRLTSFTGTVYRGNFEAGGQPIAGNVRVDVKKISLATKLEEGGRGLANLEYVAFGTAKEAFLVHPITKPPDFDQVLKVSLEGSGLTDADLAKGVRLELKGRKNDVADRLRPGRSGANAEITATVKGTEKTVRFKVENELSVLVGPDFTEGPGPR